MKKILILSWALTCFLPWAGAQSGTVSLHFSLGILSNSTGSSPVPDGSLLLVIGSANNIFSTPTPTSFLGGNPNETILWQGGFAGDTDLGAGTGTMLLQVVVPIPSGSITTGSSVEVYWYPSLLSTATAPGTGTAYGWTNGLGTVSGTGGAWIVPSAGSTSDFNFQTISNFGTLLDTAGQASSTTAAVPILYHTADTTHDWAIDLNELIRVISLYNTRYTMPDGSSKVQTGCYKVQSGTVDGFAPDPSQLAPAAAGQAGLAAYHSADTNHDGAIDLNELIRVISLYNTRYTVPDGSGKIQTGFYKVQSGTVDGYSPDPTRAP